MGAAGLLAFKMLAFFGLVYLAMTFLPLDVVGFLAAFDTCLADVAASSEDFPSIELNPDLLPEIHLDPPPPAG